MGKPNSISKSNIELCDIITTPAYIVHIKSEYIAGFNGDKVIRLKSELPDKYKFSCKTQNYIDCVNLTQLYLAFGIQLPEYDNGIVMITDYVLLINSIKNVSGMQIDIFNWHSLVMHDTILNPDWYAKPIIVLETETAKQYLDYTASEPIDINQLLTKCMFSIIQNK